jgi:hypothetical protein
VIRPLASLMLPLVLLTCGCAQDLPAVPSPRAASEALATSTSPSAWTDDLLWATCAQEWERQQPGLGWDDFAEYDPANANQFGDGFHYVVRYPLDTDSALQVRDCVVGGTPDVPTVLISPPLDDLDTDSLPAPSETFAVR